MEQGPVQVIAASVRRPRSSGGASVQHSGWSGGIPKGDKDYGALGLLREMGLCHLDQDSLSLFSHLSGRRRFPISGSARE